MTEHLVHASHSHQHGPNCGHTSLRHGDHFDYVHDGHLHKPHGDHVDECTIAIDVAHPSACTPTHQCGSHDASHAHATGCGHEAVPHGDHVDYLVGGHLHHPHGSHCDDHGVIG